MNKGYWKKRVKDYTIDLQTVRISTNESSIENIVKYKNRNTAMKSLKQALKTKNVTRPTLSEIMCKVMNALCDENGEESKNITYLVEDILYIVHIKQSYTRLKKEAYEFSVNEKGENIYQKRRKQTQATLYRFFGNLFHRQYERRLIELIQPQLEELLREEVSFYMYNNVFSIDVPYSEQCIKLNDDIEIYFNFNELFDTENNCVEVTFSHIKFGKEVVYARSMGKEIEKILHAAEEYKPANAGLYVHRCVEEAIYNNFTPTKEEIAIAERNGKVLREVLRVSKELKQCAV